jgi:hypothetical protein
MINDIPNTSESEYNAHGDTVQFYCPKCNTILQQLQHHLYTCCCPLFWITPEPKCVQDPTVKPIREINGVKK